MNIKSDEYLPSFERVMAKIILWIIVITMFFPFTLAPFVFSNNNVYAKELAEDSKQKVIDDVINKHIQKIEKKGYEEVRYILSPIARMEGKDFTFISFYEADIEKSILKNYIFYVKYYVISNKNHTLYFKTAQDKNEFLKNITKYQKNNYTEKTVWKGIGIETNQEELNKIITQKKKEYLAALAAAAKKKKTTSNSNYKKISSSGGIATSNTIVKYALQFNGNPYVSGGTSLTHGADCSGFTQSIYKHFGVNLPRTPAAQSRVGQAVSWSNLQPGDLVFYSGNGGKSVTHVALYIGDGQIIHARTPKKGIGIGPANIMVIMGARRVI